MSTPWEKATELMILYDCGKPVDIIPAQGNGYQRHTADNCPTRMEKVSVRTLDVENQSLRADLLTANVTLHQYMKVEMGTKLLLHDDAVRGCLLLFWLSPLPLSLALSSSVIAASSSSLANTPTSVQLSSINDTLSSILPSAFSGVNSLPNDICNSSSIIDPFRGHSLRDDPGTFCTGDSTCRFVVLLNFILLLHDAIRIRHSNIHKIRPNTPTLHRSTYN
ncbi:hypothetical protein Cgig2_021682 [Carnegiea gigantea]|uniref:Uncharacterized protein n=1 Tax=Carnegiea gigantea TaxID=171969 RepID=A0A9Q1QNG0_9CARY|nr:hypothetical protein Cgig2_021682 [Carnegiea gigantea]